MNLIIILKALGLHATGADQNIHIVLLQTVINMIKKITVMLVLTALFLACPCSAEKIKLPRYIIDTGSYVVPITYAVQKPELLDGIYYEGFIWNVGKTKRSMIIIAECEKATDPRAIQYALMAKSLCNDSRNLTNSKAYSPVEKPYPGWVSSCSAKGNGKNTLVYSGSVDNKTILLFTTTEDPETATFILDGLSVIPPEDGKDSLSANLSKIS
jgi:hypothetical protein